MEWQDKILEERVFQEGYSLNFLESINGDLLYSM